MQTIVPYLTMKDASAAIDFYKKAFGAKENARAAAEDGRRLVYADLSINGGPVYLMDEFPEHAEGGQAAHAPAPDHPSPVALVVNFSAPAEVELCVSSGSRCRLQEQDGAARHVLERAFLDGG